MKTPPLRNFLLIALLSACLFIPACAAASNGPETSTVRYIIDGDTLVLADGEKVRLIGVDTPEIHDDQHRNHYHAQKYGRDTRVIDEYAYKAKDFALKEMLHRPVRLEYGEERRDKFGRLLAYVYREPGDFFLNAELVKRGYGFAYTRFPFKYENDFRSYESEARKNRAGLWGSQ